jgi:hypothetical protein
MIMTKYLLTIIIANSDVHFQVRLTKIGRIEYRKFCNEEMVIVKFDELADHVTVRLRFFKCPSGQLPDV